jgi:hypothetical protein
VVPESDVSTPGECLAHCTLQDVRKIMGVHGHTNMEKFIRSIDRVVEHVEFFDVSKRLHAVLARGFRGCWYDGSDDDSGTMDMTTKQGRAMAIVLTLSVSTLGVIGGQKLYSPHQPHVCGCVCECGWVWVCECASV